MWQMCDTVNSRCGSECQVKSLEEHLRSVEETPLPTGTDCKLLVVLDDNRYTG